MLRKPYLPLIAASAFGLATASAPAVVLIDEDFEGIDDIADDTAFTDNIGGSLDTTGDPFNLGAGNQYVRQDDGGSGSTRVGALNSLEVLNESVFSVNFLFNEPSVANRNEAIVFRAGDSQDSNAVNVDVFFNNGTLGAFGATPVPGAYLLDTLYGFDVVVNDTAAALTDYRGGEDLASNSYDVYLTTSTGVTARVLDDVAFRNGELNIDSVFFQTFGSAQQQFTFDNFILTDDEAIVRGVSSIPEPASLALVGLGAMCLLGRRRVG